MSLAQLVRVGTTLVVVLAAALTGWQLWRYYMEEPWTRDGRIRAEVVGIAPDVSGLVSAVLVRDNQKVARGEVLFRIDRDRFALALQQAEAVLSARHVTLLQAQRDQQRYTRLDQSAVSIQRQEQAITDAQVAEANHQQALVERDIARLNLQRSEVRAPVNGYVTNLELRPGDYLAAGKAALALVDSDSFHIAGYFEETKLPRIRPGDRATARVMGEPGLIEGHVESIAAGITDRERAESANLLANVNPTFSWVRLAQRVPVRIAIDRVPEGLRLLSGRTATVTVLPGEGPAIAAR
ncbi:efflux RND transporter periplasmic adaptor subunit [Paracraurococcus ruber]|uniref:Efflux transporter periplasmic adaptor subunit n=1 Tax=Paracraurococcus ruber TaxID=77675 RepID=A0ABS1D2F3_9PROT|nr:HlyD family secretion protein [Paracraurococcus ruber]MBK1661013.1 efflux transporter periplasmic adaptor subunit [Paracraurococcus ruber]TDG26611.1 HlyD family secretion protein [Paracraurococcus ruber]